MNSPFKHLLADEAGIGRHAVASRPDQQARGPGNLPRRPGRRGHGSHASEGHRGRPYGRRVPRNLIVMGFAVALVIFSLSRVFHNVTSANMTAANVTGSVIWESANSSVANLTAVDPSLAAAGPGAPGTLIQSTARVTRNPLQAGYHSLPTDRRTTEAG